MAIKRGGSDRWRRFRSAGARSRFLQPMTRHRCEGTPRRVAASKSGDESPHSEKQASHPRPHAVSSRYSAAEEGTPPTAALLAVCETQVPLRGASVNTAAAYCGTLRVSGLLSVEDVKEHQHTEGCKQVNQRRQ
jgi:hypothetical protein